MDHICIRVSMREIERTKDPVALIDLLLGKLVEGFADPEKYLALSGTEAHDRAIQAALAWNNATFAPGADR